jgi:ERCC4-type nuclease
MDVLERQATLKTFSIIIDTREQDTPKARERYAAFGVPVRRATLDYGDYAGEVTLDDGSGIFDESTRIKAKCVIERKMSLDELAGCLGRDRARFQREFERATTAGATVYLLVENASYEAILQKRYRSRMHPEALLASLIAWQTRYNLKVVFCKEATSGRLIKEILYRDIKERLERGDFG